MFNHIKLIIALAIIGGSLTYVWCSNRKYSEETSSGLKLIPLGGIFYIPSPTTTPQPDGIRNFGPQPWEDRLTRRKRMVENLNLSPEQQKQLEKIGYYNPTDEPGGFWQIREKLDEILTPEQREIMRKEREERRARWNRMFEEPSPTPPPGELNTPESPYSVTEESVLKENFE